MNLNPFAFLIETQTFPLARFQRSSLWNKIKDTYVVFFGTVACPYELLFLNPGIIDYLTFGILYFFTLAWPLPFERKFTPLLNKLTEVLEEFLPTYLFRAVKACFLLPLYLFLVVSIFLGWGLYITSTAFRISVCASLTLLVSPFVALAHVYFSLQGEGLQLRKHAYGMFETDLVIADEESNTEQETDSFAFVCSEIRRRSGELIHYRSLNIKNDLAKPFYSDHVRSGLLNPELCYAGTVQFGCLWYDYPRVASRLDSELAIFWALGSNRPLSVFLRADTPVYLNLDLNPEWLPEVEIRPGEENKLLWLRAILALNIGRLAERLENAKESTFSSSSDRYEFFGSNRVKDPAPLFSKVLPLNHKTSHELRMVAYYPLALSLWLDLIAKMQTFNLQEIVPSEIIPEDALTKHVFAFL